MYFILKSLEFVVFVPAQIRGNNHSSTTQVRLKKLNYRSLPCTGITLVQGLNFIAAIAVEGEQNAVDHCGNDDNFLPYSAIFILFTVLLSCVNHYFSLSFLRKKNTKEIRKHVSSLSAIQSNNKIKVLLK